ncbi:MurR/RpiR family transcriptional regulator [Candidatus Stoquefichus massiliensis]|uniref:MurR/RpiR family transcriptional regulator n=1 Tax=Candidatus Stoquefichus massiliensis TaxID=1470350 RepID=UPI0004B49780|nr:MurR/RpiR family transcriptional regulator [Candidatus Stoquefichus massiliensis]
MERYSSLTLQVRLTEYLFNIKKFDTNFIIAKVMLDKLSEFPDVSIEQIAYLSNTTPSTVTKFCKKLGYLGFSQIKEEATIVKFPGLTKNILDNHICHNPKDFYNYFTQSTQELYESLFILFDHQQISRIAKQLSECQKVVVYTGLHGFSSANLFCEMMRSFDIVVYEVDRDAEYSLIEKTYHLADMVFIISLTGFWLDQIFEHSDSSVISNNYDKSILLSYNLMNTDYSFKEIVDFSHINGFFESNYISSHVLQSFFILLTAYLTEYRNERNR